MPFASADCAVAAFGDLNELSRSAAPAMDAASDVQRASVIAAGVEGDVAVGWGVGGEGVGDAEGQEGEQQGGDR